MRSIAIVGGGQAGFPLAFGLLAAGYQVTMVSNRTPDDIRAGSVMSSQCLFNEALDIERGLGLNLWDQACPAVEGIGLTVPNPEQPGTRLIDWRARLDAPAQAVDQRLKMPAWMALFEQRGGKLLFDNVDLAQLEQLAASHDLLIVAAGKGELIKLFARDAARSPISAPQRMLALTYVTGMRAQEELGRVAFNLIPGIGEYFCFPALSTSGPCEIMVFEGLPGGPLDCWSDVKSPQQHLARSLTFLDTYLPWEAERACHAELTDERGILSGSVLPGVRHPVLTLPSGKLVFGLGDAVVLNDPITGQGANNATKAARVYLDAILAHGEQAYTRAWMEQTFARFWAYAQHVCSWTNSLLAPPPPHILGLLGAAAQCPPLANVIANGFDHPPRLFPWWNDAPGCTQFIQQQMSGQPRAA
jgi:hypothetical protein